MLFERGSYSCLGQNVRDLVVGADFNEGDEALCLFMSHEVLFQLKMLVTPGDLCALCHLSARGVVFEDANG